jgi:GPH family glycoside/pentoside/hexuronide:cation symporter
MTAVQATNPLPVENATLLTAAVPVGAGADDISAPPRLLPERGSGDRQTPTVATERPPLTFRGKTLFAAGDIVDGTINFGIGVFIFYYLTAVCGLSGTVAGGLLAVSTICDAIVDPLIGSISDNTRTRYGRRLPYMLIAAAPTALSFALLFSIPAGLHGWALAVYAGLTLLVGRLSMSFFFLPYAAASAELSADYTERSVLFAYRTFFNCVGNILLLVLGYWVFMHGREGLLSRAAYAGFGWTVGAIALAAALTTTFSTYEQRDRLRVSSKASRVGLRQLASELAEVARNGSFRSLFLCCLLFWIALGMSGTLAIHANLYFWHLPSDVIATLPLVNIVGYAVGVPLSTWLLRWFEKRDVALIGFAIMSGVQLLPAPLRIAGLLPEGAALYDILGVFAFLGGMAGTCGFVSCGSMMSDAVDEHEMLFGSRREALFFAGLLFSVKAAAGAGGFLSGMALDAIHFPQRLAESGANVVIAPQVVTNLGLVQGPLPAALGVAGAVLLLGYHITRAELARIQKQIADIQTKPAATEASAREER